MSFVHRFQAQFRKKWTLLLMFPLQIYSILSHFYLAVLKTANEHVTVIRANYTDGRSFHSYKVIPLLT